MTSLLTFADLTVISTGITFVFGVALGVIVGRWSK